MNILRTSRGSLSGRLGTAVVALLLASSASVYGQKDKKPSPPAHSAPAQHQAAPVQSHQAPAAPTHQAPPSRPMQQTPQTATPHSPQPSTPSQPQITRQNTGQPGGGQGTRGGQPTGMTPGGQGTHSGQPTGMTNGGQGTRPGQPSGMTNGTRPGQPTGMTNGTRGGQPSGMTNGTRPGQPTGMTNGTRTGQPNGMSPGGQGTRGNPGQPNNASGGRQFGNGGRPGPSANVIHTPNGGSVVKSSNGSVREVRTPGGAVIHHAPDGGRRVEVSRPGGRVVVASAGGRTGYVQRPLVVNNRTYVQRTYVVHGVSYARVYRPYSYGGVVFNVYTPYRFYRPAFYAYVYNPWARPVYYSWGWGASPWFGYYGGWFTPYPVYATPSLWLTDYLISQTLQADYQARVDAAAAVQAQNYSATPLTPDVKQAIADEVHRQLDQERAEQQNVNSANVNSAQGPPPMLSGNSSQVFVVANGLTVASAAGDCPVTAGDVLQMTAAPPQNSTYADVVVLASKGQDCRKGSMVSVALADLQEMQNQMRATIDQGLGDLQSKQGQGGLPTLPAGAAAPPDNAFGNVQPDANVQSELTQVATEADRAEQDVVNQSLDSGSSGNSANPPTISLGMTVSEVEQMMGRPKETANVGVKKIYVYKDIKVTFIDGKVSDVQ